MVINRFINRLFAKRITVQNANKAQMRLLRFMKYISEKYMCASWMNGLDASLHDALYRETGCSSFFLRDPITRVHFNKLRELHLAVNGWWRFYEDAPAEAEMEFLKLGRWYPSDKGRREPLKYEDLKNNYWSNKEYGV